jgi:hypothetical protein
MKENTQILIVEFEQWWSGFKKIGKWCYWIDNGKTKLKQLESF